MLIKQTDFQDATARYRQLQAETIRCKERRVNSLRELIESQNRRLASLQRELSELPRSLACWNAELAELEKMTDAELLAQVADMAKAAP